MYIKKEYLIEELVFDCDIMNRLDKIQNITKKNNFFEVNNNKITRFSKKIFAKTITSLPTKFQLYELAKFLDICFSEHLVHGDIHRKNIILHEGKLHLIDWEPSLRQILLNKNVLMYTAPWIDPKDKNNKELTVRTDLMCFHKLISKNKIDYYFYQDKKWDNLLNFCLSGKIPFASLLNEQQEIK